eukprot:1824616-Rhodomonas_salina.1
MLARNGPPKPRQPVLFPSVSFTKNEEDQTLLLYFAWTYPGTPGTGYSTPGWAQTDSDTPGTRVPSPPCPDDWGYAYQALRSKCTGNLGTPGTLYEEVFTIQILGWFGESENQPLFAR